MSTKPHRVFYPKMFEYDPNKDKYKDIDVFDPEANRVRKKPKKRTPRPSLRQIVGKFEPQFKAIKFLEKKNTVQVVEEALREYFEKKGEPFHDITRGYKKRPRKSSKKT